MRLRLGFILTAALLGCNLYGCEVPIEPGSSPDPLLEPTSAAVQDADPQGPDKYQVAFETTKGRFVLQVDRSLAPVGADRFYRLIKEDFYKDSKFFRVIPGFVVQWGLAADPALSQKWMGRNIPDDPVKGSNTEGTITFAKTSAPNSRTTQIFINLADNKNLDGLGFAPFGKVIKGMDVVRSFYSGYGAAASQAQGRIRRQGNAFLDAQFPKLDGIKNASIIKKNGKPVTKKPEGADSSKVSPNSSGGQTTEAGPGNTETSPEKATGNASP